MPDNKKTMADICDWLKGNWLKTYDNNKEIKDNTLFTDEGCKIDVTPPNSYDPELPQFEVPPGHTKLTLNDIQNYFGNEFWYLVVINGHDLRDSPYEYNSKCISCDYCHVSTSQWMRHCKKCDKDMCELCYKERTEDDALASGAKNWLRRKDALLACFEHEKQGHFGEKEIDTLDIDVECNLCGKNSLEKKGTWSCNRRDNKDLCLECLNSEKHKLEVREILEKSKGTWKFVCFPQKRDYGFGSYLDWIPLMRDDETESTLLYNMNPDSKYYHQVVLSAEDDHSRQGYFVYPGTLEEVLQKIRDAIPVYEKERDGGWSLCNNCPIIFLLDQAGYETLYG